MHDPHIVIPCFNEAERLLPEELERLLAQTPVRLVMVDDGSSDGTPALLEALRARAPERVTVLTLAENRGKAEAVRAGALRALELGADAVGYLDADLSTPVSEVPRLLEALAPPEVFVVMGARVAMLGRAVRRHPARHYLGRLFATAVSVILDLRVYDTQCGAKLFKRCAALEAALAAPFTSRWAFDVELLGRLLTAPRSPLDERAFVEVPLREWRDVAGSKLRPQHMARAGLDLLSMARRFGGRRRGADRERSP